MKAAIGIIAIGFSLVVASYATAQNACPCVKIVGERFICVPCK